MNYEPDIAVANSTFNDVAILLGDGDGNFRIGGSFDVLHDAYTLASGDFNEDGHLDLACGTHQSLSILHGDGNGGFTRVQDFDTVAHFKWVGVDDFDGDGHDDVDICIKDLSTVVIFPGDGSGLYGDYLALPVGSRPQSLFLPYLKGDGHPDLLTACKDDDIVTMLGNDLDRDLSLGQIRTIRATGEDSVFISATFSAQNRTELPADGDVWLTISIGHSPDVLVPAVLVGWPANPIPFEFAAFEQKDIPPMGLALPNTLSGEAILRFRLGVYPA